MIYVGTQNRELTEDPDHRARMIAAVVVEPKQLLETRKIIAPEFWTARGERWPLAMAVTRAATLNGPPFPRAHDVAPEAYRSFGNVENRGGIVEAVEREREAVMILAADALELHLAPDVAAYIGLCASYSAEVPKSLQQEVYRMANLMIDRVKKGGAERVMNNPTRYAPNLSELSSLLTRKWQDDQRGLCALCGGTLVAATKNAMLQPSADRIDSTNGSYDRSNVQVTYLACNLAKNKYGVYDFEEWIVALRGVVPADGD